MKVKFCDESRIYFRQGDNVHSIKITICTVLRKEKKHVANHCMVKHEGHAQIAIIYLNAQYTIIKGIDGYFSYPIERKEI